MKHPIPKLTDQDMRLFEPTDDALLARIEDILSQKIKLSPATRALVEAVHKKLLIAPRVQRFIDALPYRWRNSSYTPRLKLLVKELRTELITESHHASTAGEELVILATEALDSYGPISYFFIGKLRTYILVGPNERKKIEAIYVWMCRLMEEPGTQEKTQDYVGIEPGARGAVPGRF
jgi:hypothetical protein